MRFLLLVFLIGCAPIEDPFKPADLECAEPGWVECNEEVTKYIPVDAAEGEALMVYTWYYARLYLCEPHEVEICTGDKCTTELKGGYMQVTCARRTQYIVLRNQRWEEWVEGTGEVLP